MPKIDTKNNLIIWNYKDWLEGLHPQYGVSAQLFDGSYAEVSFNPFRYLGYACPGENATDCNDSSLLTGLITAIETSVTATHGFAVGGTRVYDITPSGTMDINTVLTIAGTTFDDIVRYNKSDGTEYLFATYNSAAAGDITRILSSDLTHDDTYWSVTAGGAALDKDYHHPMIVGDDDILYIGDGNVLKGLNGADTGTNIDNVLTLPGQFEIIGFSKLDNNTLVIVANNGSSTSLKGNKIGIFFWDYLSTEVYKSIYLQGACGSVFSYKGTVAMVIAGLSPDLGSNIRNLSIVIWDGQKFQTLPGSQIRSNVLPINKGVEVINDAIYMNIGGVLYIYDSPFAGIKSGLHKIAATTGTTSGALATITSGVQFLASNTGSNYYLQYFNGNYATANFQSNIVDLPFLNRKKAKIKRMKVEFRGAATGGRSVQVAFYNETGTLLAEMFSSAQKTITENNLFLEREYQATNATAGRFDSMYMLITWGTGDGTTTSPVIKRILVEYDLVNI